MDVCVDEDDGGKCDERSHPADEEHDADAQHCSDQCQPLVVVPERRTPACNQRDTRSLTRSMQSARNAGSLPTCGFGERRVEARVVDESVRHEEEVGDERRDCVQLTWKKHNSYILLGNASIQLVLLMCSTCIPIKMHDNAMRKAST